MNQTKYFAEEWKNLRDRVTQARDAYENSGLGQREECWQRLLEAEKAYHAELARQNTAFEQSK